MVPKGFSTYFTLIGCAKTINKINGFGEYVVKAWTIAAENFGNGVLLNHSTYGVSCETIWNIHSIMKYIEGNSYHLSFTDTNKFKKNWRYQLVGGYCASVIVL